MNQVKIYLFLLLLGFFCLTSNAETLASNTETANKYVVFLQKKKDAAKPSDISIRPFSLTSSPDGYLWDANLTINLNTASIYTTIKIDKTGEGIVHSEHLSHNEEKVVGYDLSFYGSGEYTVSITFHNAETYEAVIVIE